MCVAKPDIIIHINISPMTRKTEIVYGVHAVRHALRQTPDEVLELWVQDGKHKSKEINGILELAGAAEISIQQVSRDAIEKISAGAVHQGIVIKRRIRQKTINDLDSLFDGLENSSPLLLVLDGIQDPHNLGACLRTANAAGVDAVIIPKDRAVSVTATARKIASGAAEHTPVITVTNLTRALDQIKQHGIWCFGLAGDAEEEIFSVDLKGSLALVLGAEGKGLRENTRKHCDRLVRIPMLGQVESLNVSVATAVCLYEAVRQRSKS